MKADSAKIAVSYVVLSNGIGGAEQVVKKIIQNIDKDQFVPYLITNQELVEYYSDVLPANNILSLGSIFGGSYRIGSKIIEKFDRLLGIRKIFIKLKSRSVSSFIQDRKITILHAHLMYDLYLMQLLKVLNPRLKTVYTIHGFLNLNPKESNRYVLSHNKFIWLLNSVDQITSVSPLISEYLSDNFKNISQNECYIPNGVDAVEINKICSEYVEFHSSSKLLTVTYLGGEKIVKGGWVFLEAIEHLVRNGLGSKYNFLILGPISCGGLFDKKLKELVAIGANIENIGFMKSPIHLRFIKSSDLIVMPSLSEGFPIVALEAFALGVPVIGSDIGIFRKILHKHSIFDHSFESLSHLLVKASLDPLYLEEITDFSKKYAVPFWSDIAKKYESQYLLLKNS